MNINELLLFIAVITFAALSLWINHYWTEECLRLNREWYHYCLSIIDDCYKEDIEDDKRMQSEKMSIDEC